MVSRLSLLAIVVTALSLSTRVAAGQLPRNVVLAGNNDAGLISGIKNVRAAEEQQQPWSLLSLYRSISGDKEISAVSNAVAAATGALAAQTKNVLSSLSSPRVPRKAGSGLYFRRSLFELYVPEIGQENVREGLEGLFSPTGIEDERDLDSAQDRNGQDGAIASKDREHGRSVQVRRYNEMREFFSSYDNPCSEVDVECLLGGKFQESHAEGQTWRENFAASSSGSAASTASVGLAGVESELDTAARDTQENTQRKTQDPWFV